MFHSFFKKKSSAVFMAGGPPASEHLLALAENRHWTILNSSLLKAVGTDRTLAVNANAMKSSATNLRAIF